MCPPPYTPRLVDRPLADLFAQLPALLIVGPRATGKTTSARRLARSVVRLDVPAEAAAFRFDADAALGAMPTPVLLDEWQEVPELMGAVRRAVDEDSSPGRFLLTGSARARRGSDAWSGIGRVVNLRMYGLTVRETAGHSDGPGFLERLAEADQAKCTKQKRAANIESAKNDFYALFGASLTPQERGKQLEAALNRLFQAYGILVKEAFHLVGTPGEGIVEQIDGIIDLKGSLYFVEMKWYKNPIGLQYRPSGNSGVAGNRTPNRSGAAGPAPA